jgi:sodium-dependent phosphate transporter
LQENPVLTYYSVLIVWKGGASRIHVTNAETVGIVFGVAGGVALLISIFFLPWLHRKLLKDDWELRWYHIFQGPLLLKRGEVPPPPADYQGSIQDYYRGHMNMEELMESRANASNDIENSGESGVIRNSTKSESESPKLESQTESTDTPVLGEHKPIIGPRPEGELFTVPVLFWQFKRFFFRGVDQDIVRLQGKRNILTGDLELMHAHAAHFDNKAEFMYSFLQVMTAASASFTHGANDVSKYSPTLLFVIIYLANCNSAIGPYTTIYYIWSTSQLKSTNPVPYWIL